MIGDVYFIVSTGHTPLIVIRAKKRRSLRGEFLPPRFSLCPTKTIRRAYCEVPIIPAENLLQPRPPQTPDEPQVGAKVNPKKGESKNESFPGSWPFPFGGELSVTSDRKYRALPHCELLGLVHCGITVTQYVPDASTTDGEIGTLTVYSMRPKPLRPVARYTAVPVPEERRTPPFPEETPVRISHLACCGSITPTEERWFPNAPVTVQTLPVGTTNGV